MELKNLVESKVQEHGGDTRKGYKAAAAVVEGLLSSGKLRSEDFSIRGMYEELCTTSLSDDAQWVAEDINTSAFPTIATKVFHSDIISAYELALGKAGMLVREAKATRTDEELIVGFDAGDTDPLIRRQGMAYEETDFGEKNWTVLLADFGRLISLTREMIYEDRTGEVLKRARDIGQAGGQHEQRMIIQTLEGTARTTMEEATYRGAIYKGSDMVQSNLYSDDHSAYDGQVNDNLAASNGLEDYTDIDAVYQLFAKMVDEAGNAVNIVPKFVVVPAALRAIAFKILRSDLLLATGNTDKANIPSYNPIRDLGDEELTIISSVFLTSSSDWYMGDPPKQIVKLTAFPAATASQGATSELAFTNQIVARFRFSHHYGVGHTDWRHVVRSTS